VLGWSGVFPSTLGKAYTLGTLPGPDYPEKCNPTANHAKDAKKLSEFKPLLRKDSGEQLERFRSGRSPLLMKVDESLRSWRPWR
jgi:hypothetical protein